MLILGCSTGLDLPLLPAGVAVTAIDLTPAMVRRTLARAAAIGRPLRAAVMNGQQLALPGAAFDVALLHLVLAVVPDPIACAREVARVLRPGGRAAIFDKWLPEGCTPSLTCLGYQTSYDGVSCNPSRNPPLWRSESLQCPSTDRGSCNLLLGPRIIALSEHLQCPSTDRGSCN